MWIKQCIVVWNKYNSHRIISVKNKIVLREFYSSFYWNICRLRKMNNSSFCMCNFILLHVIIIIIIVKRVIIYDYMWNKTKLKPWIRKIYYFDVMPYKFSYNWEENTVRIFQVDLIFSFTSLSFYPESRTCISYIN